MSAWTDARDNVTAGIASMWGAFSPVVRASIICTCAGFVLGSALTLVFLC